MKSTTIKKYNDMLYDSRPTKLNDFISNKYNIVHKRIYNKALNLYIKEWIQLKQDMKNAVDSSKYEQYIESHDLRGDKKYIAGKYIFNVDTVDEFKKRCIILEVMDDEYWKPSSCLIITNFEGTNQPNLRWRVDLTPYWNNYQSKSHKNIYDIKMNTEDHMNDLEVREFNYVSGKAKVYSENIDKEFDVDFDYLNGDTIEVSEDMILPNIFDEIE